MLNRFYVSCCVLSLIAWSAVTSVHAETSPTPTQVSNPLDLNSPNFNKEPTYIKSDSLLLKSKDRVFEYTGNVEVKHGDMTLTAETMQGDYTEQNQIKTLTALRNVYITKGPNIKAKSQRAAYDAAKEVVILSENPELEQNGSVLTADIVKIFLKENRSTAEGQVRVKLIKKEES